MSLFAIVGFGQMGGSIAAALRPQGHRILAVDSDAEVRRKALERGFADEASAELRGAADAVWLAVPVRTAVELLPSVLAVMRPEALLLDVVGTKTPLVEAFRRSNRSVEYVSLHPLAGTERAGIDAADPGIFRNAPCVILPVHASEETTVRADGLVRALGARPIRMASAEEHDAAMAVTIHLPHVLAYVLPRLTRDLELAGRSFRDSTRIALSDVSMVSDFLLANGARTTEAIDRLLDSLRRFRALLAARDEAELRKWMEEAKEIRGRI